MDWRVNSSCSHLDPEIFFPDKDEDLRLVRAVCANCPVRIDCLQFALSENVRDGIWGGMTGIERHALRKQQQRRYRDNLRKALNDA